MKVLITGAEGQLGRKLNEVLSSTNFEIISLSKSELDITQKEQVYSLINTTKPDWVINTAAYTNVESAESEPEKAHSINASGPENLALSAVRNNARLIQISTDYVFDGKSKNPYEENHKKNPKSIYGTSKSIGEDKVIAAMDSNYYIIRTSWLYSEYKSNFAKFMVSRAINGLDTVEVVNDQFGQPTYAGDLALQLLRVIRNMPEFGIYHGTNSGRCSWHEYAREIFTLAGEDPNRVQEISSLKLQRKAQRPENSSLSHSQWSRSGLKEMRNWKDALHESFPQILETVKKESNKWN
jgi:dTDP-4-dehydrorhamnose reductase